MTTLDPTARQAARLHIERLRADKYCIGPNGERLVDKENPLVADLSRAIDSLSRELYSKDTHFVLELVQNAEDNQYRPGVVPALSFELRDEDPTRSPGAEGALVIRNNEVGFSPEDVVALCAVGDSKKRKASGYIGEKGIGFKSVFKVSAAPHIFSAGYSFRLPNRELDTAAGLGFIVPYWIDEVPSWIDQAETTIVLPLLPGKKEEIAGELETFPSETILFLTKIRELQFRIGGHSTLTLSKDERDHHLVRLVATSSSTGEADGAQPRIAEFFVETSRYRVPSSVVEPRRTGIEETAVAAALPLSDGDRLKGGVYAYLPTDVNSGLPFIVNGDFLLTSGRSDIDRNCQWNRWLADCVVSSFLKAFERMLRSEHRFEAYGFLPLVDEQRKHDEFFSAPCVEIVKTLRATKSILVKGKTSRVLPSDARRASDSPAFRRLFAHGDTPEFLKRVCLVKVELERHRLQLAELGVAMVSNADLLECLSDRRWVDRQLLHWFVDLYDYLRGRKFNDEEIARLRTLPLVKTRGGQASAPKLERTDRRPVYFPIGRDKYQDLQVSGEGLPVKIRFMDEQLFGLIQEQQGSKPIVNWLEEVLRVYDFSPGNYAIDVLEYLCRESATLGSEHLVRTTALLARLVPACDDSQRKSVLAGLPLLLTDGTRRTRDEIKAEQKTLVLPEGYDPQTGWQLVFCEPQDRRHLAVLSEDYLALGREREEGRALLRFIGSIPATETPLPEFAKVSRWDGHATAFEQQTIDAHQAYSTVGKTIEDWRCPMWLKNLARDRAPADLARRAEALARWLGAAIAGPPSDKPSWADAKIEWRYYGWHTELLPSEFTTFLRRAPWLRTSMGFRAPSEALIESAATRELLGDTVAYVKTSLSRPAVEFLGVRYQATTQGVLDLLSEHARAGSAEKSFAVRAYRFLNVSGSPELRQKFAADRLIFLTNPTPRWLGLSDVIWSDQSDVFADLYGYLEVEYPDLRSFFVDKLGVAEGVGLREYVTAWKRLAATAEPDVGHVERALEMIYAAIGLHLQGSTGEDSPEWWEEEWSDLAVWTERHKFADPAAVLLADDGDMKRVFREGGPEYIWIPGSMPWARAALVCRELGVRRLSEAVSSTADSRGRHPMDPSESTYLTQGAKLLILALVWNRDPGEFAALQANGLAESLLLTRECPLEELEVRFTLKDLVRSEKRLAFWSSHDDLLLVRSSSAPLDAVRREVAENLARQLGQTTLHEAEDQVFSLLCTSMGDARTIMAKRGWAIPPGLDAPPEADSKSPVSDVQEEAEGILPLSLLPARDTGPEMDGHSPGAHEPTDGLVPPRSPQPSDSPVPHGGAAPAADDLSYGELVRARFARPAKSAAVQGLILPGSLPDPERRRLKIEHEILDGRRTEPPPDARFEVVPRKVWEDKDCQVRLFLMAQYGGHCQVCNQTFTKRNGEPYFQGIYLVGHTHARWIDRPGNVLCLCATCSAKFQHGSVELDGFNEAILALQPAPGTSGDRIALPLRLCGDECHIHFSNRHLIDLQELVRLGNAESV